MSLHTSPHGARVRVVAGDHTVADTREGLIAWLDTGAPFYLLPRAAVDAELVADGPAEGGSRRHQLIVDGRVISTAVTYADSPDHVRLDAADLYDTGARWSPGALRWFEEERPSFPFARNPYHRVDVLPLSQTVTLSVDGAPLLETTGALLVLEAPLPPRIYLPRSAFPDAALAASPGGETVCPYKGVATYFDLMTPERSLERFVWSYDASDRHNHILPALAGYRGVIPGDGVELRLS